MAAAKRTPSGDYATDQEVEAAIAALSPTDAERLQRYATYRALALVGTGLGKSGDDLLQEAILRTFEGRKRWRKTVSFVKHLKQAIRNIAGHAPAELRGARVVTVTEERDVDGPDAAILCSSTHDGERAAAAHEILTKIATAFESDEEAWLVMEGLSGGKNGPEIQSDLKISKTQYETIMTRLRRGVDREQGWRP